MKAFVAGLCLLALSCGNGNDVTGPPTTTTVPDPGPIRPPRVDAPVDLWDVEGVTAFGAALLSEPELVGFVHYIQSLGKNVLRVGAQTDGWCGGDGSGPAGASCGPPFGSEEWRENLTRLMDVTARIPGIWLQLIPTFTHKNESFQRNMEITKAVIKIQQAGSPEDSRPYEHIVWEAVNEVIHPITSGSLRGNIVKLLRDLKSLTGLPVGTDHPGEYSWTDDKWRGNYPDDWLPWVDYVAFHPPRYDECRDIRPDVWQLRRAVRNYARPVWIDEPTAYLSDQSKALYGIDDRDGHYAHCGGKTEGRRRQYISAYRGDVLFAGGIWFTHAAWLFECRAAGWLPS